MNSKASISELSSRVDAVLWSDWDPIGVNDSPEAEGEYSDYVQAVVTLLFNGADEQKLAHHLHAIEQVSMGISTGLDHCRHVARKLLETYRRTEADSIWMQRCEELARQASLAGNTPVGALVVLDGVIVGEAAEQTPRGDRRFAHAELLAVEESLRALGRRTLETATLYSTAEPCILCGYAIREAHISRVVVIRPSGATGSIRSRFPVLTADWVERWGPPPEIIWWASQK